MVEILKELFRNGKFAVLITINVRDDWKCEVIANGISNLEELEEKFAPVGEGATNWLTSVAIGAAVKIFAERAQMSPTEYLQLVKEIVDAENL